MPYCPECGKRVAAHAKFCRYCGASQAEEPEDREIDISSNNFLCSACNSPLLPDDRFCGNCGAPAGNVPPAAVEGPAVTVPLPQIPLQACPSCGAPSDPGTKFCGICGAPALQPPAPPTPLPAEVLAVNICTGCNSPLTGSEKFCGICGQKTGTARPPPLESQATATPAGKFCSVCGTAVKADIRFCGECGAPAGTFASRSSQVPDAWEVILGIIPDARRMKLFGVACDTFTIVVTGQRMIFARLTPSMQKAALAIAKDAAMAGGNVSSVLKRYETMSPEQALHETPGNVALQNQSITAISLVPMNAKKPGIALRELRMTVESVEGKTEYIIPGDDRFVSLLRTAYGARVKPH
ncbi:MAG: zinc ribbon domain-containing protein [Methanoregula sp.]